MGTPAVAASKAAKTTEAALILSVLVLLSFELVGMFPVFTVLVVFLPFFRVAQYFIGFVDLLEFPVSIRIVRIQVRMIFTGQLLVRFFDVVL